MSKTKWILLGIIFLAIIVIGFFAMNLIGDITSPKVTVKIDVLELTMDNVSLNITMHIENQNPYSMVIEDMDVEVMSSDGTFIGELIFPKKTVNPNDEITVSSRGNFGFNNQPLEEIYSEITARFGVNFYDFFSVSLPVNINIITDPKLVIDAIVLPVVTIDADIGSIDENGVMLNGMIQVDNQNDFSLAIQNTDIIIKHNQTPVNADISIIDTIIQPKSISSINFSAIVGYDVFDSGTLSASVTGDIKVSISGISMNRSFTTSAQMSIPDIASYIMDNEPIEISLSADFDIKASGVDLIVGFKLYNPTNIPLLASDLDILIYRVDNDNKTLIAQDLLENCPLPPKNEVCLQDTFPLPIISFIPILGDGLPDWFLLSLEGDFMIGNSTQRIPVKINGFLSGNFF